MQDIFEDLQDIGPIPEVGDNAYKVAIRKLDFYFRIEKNIPYARYVFRQLSLQETANQFMVHLCKQARHCNFGTSINDNSSKRDQLFERLTDFELKRELLKQKIITLVLGKWLEDRQQIMDSKATLNVD